MTISTNIRLPAEWEKHSKTIIAWPDFGDSLMSNYPHVTWGMLEMVRVLSQYEEVVVLVPSAGIKTELEGILTLFSAGTHFTIKISETEDLWMRDAAPTAVIQDNSKVSLIVWGSRKVAPIRNRVADFVSASENLECITALSPKTNASFILEGGMFDTDGLGSLLVTEECLFSDKVTRGNEINKADYEEIFLKFLGINNTFWLPFGLANDTTNGHIDNVARFLRPGVIALAKTDDPASPHYERLLKNKEYLLEESQRRDGGLEFIEIHLPDAISFDDQTLPASYLNFYIANDVVLVPTFNDPFDILALDQIQENFPERKVIGIHARQLIVGSGTVHCLTQQLPALD